MTTPTKCVGCRQLKTTGDWWYVWGDKNDDDTKTGPHYICKICLLKARARIKLRHASTGERPVGAASGL